MLLNHIATIFLSSGTWLCESFLAIGYFTAITMTCFLVEGYHYTHSKKIYILRLFVFALISEIPYCFAFTINGIIEFYGFNMLFTLCICFGILYILDTIKNRFAKVCLIILAVIISLFCDWALLAPIFTLLFVWANNSKHRTKIAFCLSIVIFGTFNFLGGLGRFPFSTNILYALLSIVGMGMAAVCIVFFYNGKEALLPSHREPGTESRLHAVPDDFPSQLFPSLPPGPICGERDDSGAPSTGHRESSGSGRNIQPSPTDL